MIKIRSSGTPQDLLPPIEVGHPPRNRIGGPLSVRESHPQELAAYRLAEVPSWRGNGCLGASSDDILFIMWWPRSGWRR